MNEHGFATLVAFCGLCEAVFTANPERVPTFLVERHRPRGLMRLVKEGGTREPVCRDCFDAINRARIDVGAPPLVALAGAWEAADCP